MGGGGRNMVLQQNLWYYFKNYYTSPKKVWNFVYYGKSMILQKKHGTLENYS